MNATTGFPRVAVIGGGWAGCAAACTLAEAGIPTTLFEASRTLGGRARSVELDGRVLDNGQHILLGAYGHSLEMIRRLAPDAADSGLWRLPLEIEIPPAFRLACPRLPAPLHLLAGLAGARGLDWREKWQAARWVRRIVNGPNDSDGGTVAALTRDQPQRLNQLLWHPLCVSALNTPPAQASARTFRTVLRDAFGKRRADSDLLLPCRDLSTLLPVRAAERVIALGGTVHSGTRIEMIEAEGDALRVQGSEADWRFSHVVIAVAPQHLARLTAGLPALEPVREQVAAFRYLPIATGYVQYDPAFRLARPMLGLDDGPAQFVFDRGQSHGQPGMLAFVASAATQLPADWLDRAERQLRRFATPGTPHWRRSIVEKQATYACVPGMTRPGVRTPHPRVYLAGDYTDGPYPATLESAVSSGVQSAQTLLDTL